MHAPVSDVLAPTALAPAPAAARPAAPTLLGRIGAVVMAALPGVLTIYLSFNAGGYFPGAQGAAVAVLAGAVALRMAFVRDPFVGFGRPLQVATGALAAYSLWCLLSSRWSHSPSRALLDFNLANIYLLALILFGSSLRTHRRVRWTAGLTWGAMLFVCVAALVTRFRPDLFPLPPQFAADRLGFPLTYWNALGVFAVMGMTLTVHFASSTRERGAMRVFATATIPIFAVTILLTYSRAALVLGVLGLIVYLLLARPRGAVSAAIAAGPTSAFAVTRAYHANLISNGSTSAAAVVQGRHLTTTIVLACLAAGLIRVALLELDARLAKVTLSARRRKDARTAITAACIGALLVASLTFGGQISRQWNNFTKLDSSVGRNDVRNRIGSFRIGGRITGWRIALKSFDQDPFHGHGAGTFAIDWDQRRGDGTTALETHSLYLEAMGELGVVGLVTVVTALVTMLGACFIRGRRGSALWTGIGAVALIWAVHAGVDWDWEMPAVTLPVVALAAGALSRRGQRPSALHFRLPLRVGVGLVAIVLLVVGMRVSVSDRHLVRSVAEFNTGNCAGAAADAHGTIDAISARPQPYAIIGYCDVLTGRAGAAVTAMGAAVVRDPQNWRYIYGLAVATAANGRDPGPALARARALDPREPMIVAASAQFHGRNRLRWKREAVSVQMPVSTRQ